MQNTVINRKHTLSAVVFYHIRATVKTHHSHKPVFIETIASFTSAVLAVEEKV